MVGKIIGAGTGHALPKRNGHVLTQSPLVAQAHSDLSLIRRRKGEMGDVFFDLGEALVRLRRPGVAQALSYPDTYAMVREEAGLAPALVDELVEIVTHVTRNEAERMGHGRSAILARLAATTPTPAAVVKPEKSKTRKTRASSGDKAIATAMEEKLRALGVKTAKVRIVAGALKIEGVPVEKRALLKRVL